MSHLFGFTYCGLLAEGGFFELVGPLLLFGIYAIGALAKKWFNSRDPDSEEKKPSELQKAVRKRYQQIHQRQTGSSSGQGQPPRRTEPVRTVHTMRPVEPPTPVRQPAQRTYPVQAERQRRPVQQKKYLQQNTRQKPVSAKTQAPKPVQKLQRVKSNEAKSAKSGCVQHSLASLIRQPQNLRTAIILKEILDKPLALRDF